MFPKAPFAGLFEATFGAFAEPVLTTLSSRHLKATGGHPCHCTTTSPLSQATW